LKHIVLSRELGKDKVKEVQKLGWIEPKGEPTLVALSLLLDEESSIGRKKHVIGQAGNEALESHLEELVLGLNHNHHCSKTSNNNNYRKGSKACVCMEGDDG